VFSQLLKLVCVRVTQIPFGIVPVQLLLAHHYWCGLILAITSILKVRHLTRHRKDTSSYLLSPLLFIFDIIYGGSLIKHTHIHTTLRRSQLPKIVRGLYMSPTQYKRRQSVLLPKHSRPVHVQRNRSFSRWYIRNVYCAEKQNTFLTVHQKCVVWTETEHFLDGTSEMCTVNRNRTLSWRYIRNVYCEQKQNIFKTVHQKCVLCKETDHFPDGILLLLLYQKCVLCRETEHFLDGTSEMCTVNRNRTFSRRYIRNVYCAQKQNTFQTVHQKFVLGTETEHFQDGTSEIYTGHRDRTLSRRYIRNLYCAQKQNTFLTVHKKCEQCTETEHFPYCTSEMCTVHRKRTLSRRYIRKV